MIPKDLNSHNMGEIRKLSLKLLDDVCYASQMCDSPATNFLLEGATRKIRKIYELTKFQKNG